jgi:hypothetical protein
MKFVNFLTPQVRTFIYGAVAALLSVATVQGWVSDDLAKSIQENLPTIFGAVASILAAANVKQKSSTIEVVENVVPVSPSAPTQIVSKPVIGVPQGPVVEEPMK